MKNVVLIDPARKHLKGNIHMHTTRSDGKYSPKDAAEKFRQAGYDFIMMSDHEIYWNSDELDRPDFLVLGGTETSICMNGTHRWILDYRWRENPTTRVQHTYMHYCCIKDESVPDVGQYFPHDYMVPRMVDRGIDSWNRQVDFMREHGNIVIVNHPHWSRLAPELLLASQNIAGFEVWNSGNVNKCAGRTDEDIWDYCLTRGKRLLAVAADDSHEMTTDFAAGFTVVECDAFSKADICRAFKEGSFYASCGPLVHEAVIENGVLRMRFTPVRHVKIAGYDRDGYDFFPGGDQLIASLEWKVDESMRYFRPVLIDAKGNTAWMQPVFVEDLLEG